MKCFRKSGITDDSFSIVTRSYEDEDPFDDLEAQEELCDLVGHIPDSCTVDEYINGEKDVHICMQYDEDWESDFFSELLDSSHADSLAPDDPNEQEVEEQFDLEPPPPKITRFEDAMSSLEDVQVFLDSKGFLEQATIITASMNELAHLHLKSKSRQSTLQEFFLYSYLGFYFVMLLCRTKFTSKI